MKSSPKSMEDIAKLAAVSKTAVSMVINGTADKYRISKDTQARIIRIAEKYNFQPNLQARGFRLKSTSTIGLVVPDLVNPFFNALSYHLELISKKHGFNLIVASSNDDADMEERVVNNLLAKAIDGIILSSVRTNIDTPNTKTPIIYIDRKVEGTGCFSVVSDNYGGAYQITEYLIRKGCQRIAFIGGLAELITNQERRDGYRAALKAHQLIADEAFICEKAFTKNHGFHAAKKLFQKTEQQQPDAVFTAAYILLEGVLSYINGDHRHRQLPETIHIATFDDHPLLDFLAYNITSMKQNDQLIAKQAFQMVYNAMQGIDGFKNRVVKTRLIIRE